MMNKFLKFQLSWLLVVLLIATINSACSKIGNSGKSQIEISSETYAEKITVLIRRSTVIPPIKMIPVGSGVIIARKKKGDNYLYYILTADHSVFHNNNYQVVTHDKKEHLGQYDPEDLKSNSKCLDLAVLKFTSNQNYPLAKLDYFDELSKDTPINVIGWANGKTLQSIDGTMINPKFRSSPEENQVCERLAFDNSQGGPEPMPGMSGGAILNEKSDLVGIYVARNLFGHNLGISIQDFRENASKDLLQTIQKSRFIETQPKNKDIENTRFFNWTALIASLATIATLFVTIYSLRK